jgi:structural maintenance of chromosome 2
MYDPSGTLSGGAPPQSSGVLVKVKELIEADNALREKEAEVERLNQMYGGKQAEKRDAWRKGKRDLEIKEHELRLLEEQVGGSNASRVSCSSSSFRLLTNLRMHRSVPRSRL